MPDSNPGPLSQKSGALNVLTVRIVARSTWDLKKICKSDAKSSVRQIGCFKIRVGQQKDDDATVYQGAVIFENNFGHMS